MSFDHASLTHKKTRGRLELPAVFVSQLLLQNEEERAVIKNPNLASNLIDKKPGHWTATSSFGLVSGSIIRGLT